MFRTAQPDTGGRLPGQIALSEALSPGLGLHFIGDGLDRCTVALPFCDRLVNLDARPGVAGIVCVQFEDGELDELRLELGEISWADYVNWSHKERFAWHYSGPAQLQNRSTYYSNPNDDLSFPEIAQHEDCFWWSLFCCKAESPNYGVDLRHVSGMSLVLNPRNCGADAAGVFERLVRRNNLSVVDRLG